MERHERIFRYCIAAMALALIMLFLLQLARTDYSLRQNENRRKFGAVYMTMNNPFYEIIDEEIRAAVENNGDVLISRDPALSQERQNEEIEELVKSGVSLLFVNPADQKTVTPAIKAAAKAGVPVIAIDTGLYDDDYAAVTVTSDNYEAGKICAEHLIAHSDGWKIALLKHSAAQSASERIRGFTDALTGHDEFEIVAEEECLGQLEIAMPAMEKILTEHGAVDAVMAINDPSAMGALAALQNFGLLNDVYVYGVDGVKETRELIKSGVMTATAVQQPREIGRIAARLAYRILAGEKPDKLIRLPAVLLTRDNADEVPKWD